MHSLYALVFAAALATVTPANAADRWENELSLPAVDQIAPIDWRVDQGTLFVVGETEPQGASAGTFPWGRPVVAAFDARSGAPLWRFAFANLTSRGYAKQIAIAADGSLLVAGLASRYGSAQSLRIGLVARLSRDGQLLWQRELPNAEDPEVVSNDAGELIVRDRTYEAPGAWRMALEDGRITAETAGIYSIFSAVGDRFIETNGATGLYELGAGFDRTRSTPRPHGHSTSTRVGGSTYFAGCVGEGNSGCTYSAVPLEPDSFTLGPPVSDVVPIRLLSFPLQLVYGTRVDNGQLRILQLDASGQLRALDVVPPFVVESGNVFRGSGDRILLTDIALDENDDYVVRAAAISGDGSTAWNEVQDVAQMVRGDTFDRIRSSPVKLLSTGADRVWLAEQGTGASTQPILRQLDETNGQTLLQQPALVGNARVYGGAAADGPDVFVYGAADGHPGPRVHVRAIRESDGVVLWSADDAMQRLEVTPVGPTLAVSSSVVALGLTGRTESLRQTEFFSRSYGESALVVAFDRRTGAPLWRSEQQSESGINIRQAGLAAATDGTVYTLSEIWSTSSVRRLCAIAPTGTQRWCLPDSANPSAVFVFGDAVYAAVPGSLLRLDPETGATLLSMTLPTGSVLLAVRRLGNGDVVTAARRNDPGSTRTRYGVITNRHDATTGTQLWTHEFGTTNLRHDVLRGLFADDTDIVLAGSSWQATANMSPFAVVLDATTGQPRWERIYQGHPGKETELNSIRRLSSGDWMIGAITQDPTRRYWVVTASAVDGTLGAWRSLSPPSMTWRYYNDDPSFASVADTSPETDGLTTVDSHWYEGGMPVLRTRSRAWSNPGQGELRVAADIQPSASGTDARFAVTMVYTGDRAVQGAILKIVVPPGYALVDVECSVTGTGACASDDRAQVSATADLQPGSTLVVRGALTGRVNATPRQELIAAGALPFEFVQQDPRTSEVAVWLDGTLFSDGFE